MIAGESRATLKLCESCGPEIILSRYARRARLRALALFDAKIQWRRETTYARDTVPLLLAEVNAGKRLEQSEDIQQP